MAGLALFSALALSAEIDPPPADITLDEIEVRAARMRLDELRREMTRLEDQIYARYNDLNTVEQYDVLCSDYTRTGTRLARRYCRPVFEERAKNEEGQVAARSMQQIRDLHAPLGTASVELPEPPVPKILAQMPAYQRHMRRVMEADAQLQRLLRERAAVVEEYNRSQREVFSR